MKDFYFVDRSYNLLGIATAGNDNTNDFKISGEIERTNVDVAMVAFTGTLYFPKKQLSKAETMCQDLNYMLYMDDDGNGRMITITASHADGTGYNIAFEGTDAGNDLKNEILGAYTATTQMTFEQYFNLFTDDSGWDIGVNEIPTDVRTLTFDSEQTSYDRMNSVATQFGVETYFSFSIVGTTMVKCYLNVVKKHGADRGVTLRVGDEINRITVDSDSTNLMTAIYARGATPDGSNTPINLVGYSYTDPTGQFVLTKEGFLLDTVSNRIYSRLRQNSTATIYGSYLNHVIDYEAKTQASLLQSALADLKKNNHPAVNYTIELAKMPQNIHCGDTVQIEQEDRQLYLSARVLELDKCYSNPSNSTMVVGDYLLETSQVAKQYQDLAQKLKDISKTIQYYPWVRYADDTSGSEMSALPDGKTYMALVWGQTATPSDDPADYSGKWVRIVGANGKDGSDGIAGPKGADGKTPYFHTAYAKSLDGKTGFSTTDSSGAIFMGTVTDYTQTDPATPSAYTWVKIKGDTGDPGPRGTQGLQGDKGDQGVAGQPGKDGKTSYTHFMYADDAKGKNMEQDPGAHAYVGMYVDFTSQDSTNPSSYGWSLIKGEDGKDGTPGKAGADGKTPYFHTAYADSEDGSKNFSITEAGTRAYLGTYTDYTQLDSSDPTKYLWSKIMGPQGDQGLQGLQGLQGPQGDQGIQGPDGKPSYTHIAYGTSSSGAGLTQTPSASTTYIGMYVDNVATDSKSASAYKWTLIKGADGADGTPGKAGADGKTPYVHTAWADLDDQSLNMNNWLLSNSAQQAGTISYKNGVNTLSYKGVGGYEQYSLPLKCVVGKPVKITISWTQPSVNVLSSDHNGVSASLDNHSITDSGSTTGEFPIYFGTDATDHKIFTITGTATNSTMYLNMNLGFLADNISETFICSVQQNFNVSETNNNLCMGVMTNYIKEDSYDPSDYTWAKVKGETGKDGVAGKDGVGIKSTTIMYAQSTSGTTAPNTGWTAQVPTLIKGQYLWTQTTWVYTDNTGEAGYTVSYNAKDGNTGSNGIAGKDGVGIKSTTITYQGGTSGTVQPTGTWVANPPSVDAGNYLWTRTVWSYTDGTSETGYSVAKAGEKGDKGDTGDRGLQGLQGPQGNQGIQGPKGVDGKSSYTHIAYANSSDSERNVNNWVLSDPAKQATKIAYKDGINIIDYKGVGNWENFGMPIKATKGTKFRFTFSWSQPATSGYLSVYLSEDKNGASGSGTPAGVKKLDLASAAQTNKIYTIEDTATTDTMYLVFTGGPVADGIQYQFKLSIQQDFSQDPGNHEYMGWYSDFTETDSNDPSQYGWSLIKGADGADGTPGKAGADGKTPYFHIAYANSADGKDGFYVGGGTNLLIGTSSSEQSYTSDFSTVPGWGTAFVAVNAGSTYTYSINLTKLTGSFVLGYWGYDSNKNYSGWFQSAAYSSSGKVSWTFTVPSGISYIVPHVVHASNDFTCTAKEEKLELGTIATPWSPAPSEAHPVYLGTYTDYTQADSLDPTAYLWSQVKGDKGDKGDSGRDGVAGKDGVGIKSTTITYQASTSGTTAPTGTWVASPTATSGQYQWTRTVWTYTDGTTETGYSVGHIGANGANGQDGVAGKPGVGIKSTTITYATSTSGTSAPTGGWVSTPPATAPGQFMWTRTIWSYTDGTNETGYSVAKAGEKGETGNTGATGANGKSVWSYPYDRGANRSNNWWSDLKPAPTTSNQPKVGDTLIDLAGNMYQITNVVLGSTDQGGGTFDYGSLLTSIKGPQGPAGNDITSYASGTTLPTTVAPANSQFWLTDSAGVAIKFYKSTGSAWVEQQISAAAINAATFNGLSFTGVFFNGSTFKSTYTDVQPDGFSYKVHGDSTLTNGALVTNAYNDSNVQVSHTEVNQTGLLAQGFISGNKVAEISLREGQLLLGATYKASSNAPDRWTSSSLDAETIFQLNQTGKLLWSGKTQLGDGQSITPSLPMTSCLNGWKIGIAVAGGNRFSWFHLSKEKALESPGIGHTIPIFDFNSGGGGMYLHVSNTNLYGDTSVNLKGIASGYYIYEIRAF